MLHSSWYVNVVDVSYILNFEELGAWTDKVFDRDRTYILTENMILCNIIKGKGKEKTQ